METSLNERVLFVDTHGNGDIPAIVTYIHPEDPKKQTVCLTVLYSAQPQYIETSRYSEDFIPGTWHR